jgi:hypothetical protein
MRRRRSPVAGEDESRAGHGYPAHRLADALAAYIAELETHITTTPGKSEGVAA